jgi:TonB-dependent receptor
MKHSSIVCAIGLVILLIPAAAQGQTTISGTVSDSLTNDRLVGVNVVLVGTSIGAATDLNGEFLILGVSANEYQVKVYCIGYEPTILAVDCSGGGPVRLTIRLKQTILQGEEVVVRGQLRGQVAAINQQRTSNTIINVVSEEKIRELPDANAAEAIGRLPGVSLIRSGGEASGVVLRGLSSKFSNITVDGVKIPPTDPNSRDVDLSMLSQGSLAGIELHKTLTPDQDADAIAGSINLVTKKAPSERLVQVDTKGDYNYLMKSGKQYDVLARYGERFFDDILGIQLQANSERKIRSRENTLYGYGTSDNQTLSTWGTYDPSVYDNDYSVNRFTARFTDELRERNGGQAILDMNTPDDGSIKLTGVYSETGRNIMTDERAYPSGNGGYDYNYQYSEVNTSTSNGSLQGKNHLFGLTADWSAAFAQSRTKNPFGYRMSFQEPNGGTYSPYKNQPDVNVIPFAYNNFSAAVLDSTDYYRTENFDKEKTFHLDLSRKFTLWEMFTNDLKVGGKYKEKNRWMNTGDYVWNNYKVYALKNADGSTIDPTGTRFEGVANSAVSLSRFLDAQTVTRDVLGLYRMTPLMSTDALRQWWNLNKKGIAAAAQDYGPNGLTLLNDYYVTERVSSGYIMNTLDIGQSATLLFGVRVESESNDYNSRYSDASVGGTGAVVTLNGKVIDTTAKYTETIWLPSAQLALRPTDFLSIRFAAYRALGRPDFNWRLAQFAPGSGATVFVAGNPNLRDAKAWNYEINTQVYDNTIGLFSVSAFYKVIDDLYHQTNNVNLSWPSGGPNRLIGYKGWTTNAEAGYYYRFDELLKYLNMSSWLQNGTFVNLTHNSPTYTVNLAYNSPEPSYAWGFELEHQMNFGFLPVTWLQKITLSYNVSITRSQTNIIVGKSVNDTVYVPASGTPGTPRYKPDTTALLSDGIAVLEKRDSEDQPKLYGNVALGYDIGGFSARVSFFYQSRYTRQYSANGTADAIVNAFAKWDLALKQQLIPAVALFLNVNNFTNRQETTSRFNSVFDWGYLPRTAELYGTTVEFGVRLLL